MSGIEFYPQKEFDDDMEDKSDNDKIRVSRFFVSRDICGAIFFLGIRMILSFNPASFTNMQRVL